MPGNAELELTVTGLATGGEGVARLEGRVVFIPGGLPGDRLAVTLTEDRGRFLRARLERVVEPSPDRRTPPCPVADRCGGCPWMALREPAQATAKQAQVEELMARIGGLPRGVVTPLVEAPSPLGYRNRLRLLVEGDRLGFRAAGSREVVDVARCAVAMPALNTLLEAVRAHLAPHLPLKAPLQLELAETEHGARHLAASGVDAPRFAGFRPPLEHPLEVRIDPRPLDARGAPRLPFAQANFAQNTRLVAEVREALELTPGSRVLDLYAGAGNFSLGLAGAVKEVVGIESNPGAVTAANEAAPPNARYLAGDAVTRLKALIRAGERFDRVVLDPPRAGALEVCELLPRVHPARIAYVSCDPATLARDLKRLVGLGFHLEGVRPYDLMPQTAHVECLAVLSK